MHILVIESDLHLRLALKTKLESHAFIIDEAQDGERGLFLARINDYDVILLGYTHLKSQCLDICQEIRKNKKDQYIVVVSADITTASKVDLLNSGADDCLEHAYSFDELLARIHAFTRHLKSVEAIFSYKDLSLNRQNQTVLRGTKEIKLTRKEFMLLEHLIQSRGEVVSRAALIERIWNSHLATASNTIESHVLSLRKKIDRKNRQSMIQTVSGRGYRIG